MGLFKSKLKDDAYYQDSSDWYHDRYESLTVAKSRYQLLAGLLGLLLTLSMLVTVSLLPLKQYAYRLIAINQQTGEVSQLNEIDSNKYETNWVVARYFVHQYVLNRHSYSSEDIKRTLNLALAMSTKPIADEHIRETIDTNPQSPLNILNKEYYREVNILSINQLNERTALVRFKTITNRKNAANESKTEDLQAVVKWEFSHDPATLSDRDKNPLGFMVNYYQVSPIFTKNNERNS